MTDYPKEIFISNESREEITAPTARENLEKAYDYGRVSVESLDGWSNLTKAVKEEADIDWEKLDGVPAKCVHPELGTLTYKLERDEEIEELDYAGAWWKPKNSVWNEALGSGWEGECKWTLYIKGEIPPKPKTADQLPAGTCFLGQEIGKTCPLKAVLLQFSGGYKYVLRIGHQGVYNPQNFEVLEEYGIGTFNV